MSIHPNLAISRDGRVVVEAPLFGRLNLIRSSPSQVYLARECDIKSSKYQGYHRLRTAYPTPHDAVFYISPSRLVPAPYHFLGFLQYLFSALTAVPK